MTPADAPRRLKVLYLTNIPSPYRVDFFNELGKQCDLTVLYERKAATDRDSSWSGDGATTFTEVFLPGIRTKADAALCPAGAWAKAGDGASTGKAVHAAAITIGRRRRRVMGHLGDKVIGSGMIL